MGNPVVNRMINVDGLIYRSNGVCMAVRNYVYGLPMVAVSFILALVISILGDGNALAAKRVALVIGNSQYENTSPLKNPVNDANLMAASLEEAGFEVTKILDADFKTLKRAMLDFGRNLRNSPEAGLFYYAGHGVQVHGENYLIPVNAQISDEDEVDLEAININSFLRVMNSSSSAINIVVLDACRNNPFARSFRSVSRGLAPVDAPKGTYIAYATAPGAVAADGIGNNSPYSVALASAIKKRGITIEQVFKQARKSVLESTNSKQVPWETSSITGNFYFNKSEKLVDQPIVKKKITQPLLQNQPVDQSILLARIEAENVYKQVKDSKNIEVLEIFTKQFPDSIYTKFIQVRIKTLKKQASLSNEKSLKRNSVNDIEKTDAEDTLIRADAAYEDKQYREAARLYQLAADLGNADAMNSLGILYEIGRGVSKDLKRAARLYGMASNNGHLTAAKNLASLERNENLNTNQNTNTNNTQRNLLSGEQLARNIQQELNRLGCDAGSVDGKWGDGSRRALQRYRSNANTRVSSTEPTNILLDDLKSKNSRICPLECKTGFGIRDNKCVRLKAVEQIKSDACKKLFREYRKKGPIRAFAISSNGLTCGSAWNYETKKLASSTSIDSCTKQGGTGCHVIEVSNPAKSPQSAECRKPYKEWKRKRGFKAFAISGSGQACGWGTNYSNRKDAINNALRQCRKNRKGCHIVASANR